MHCKQICAAEQIYLLSGVNLRNVFLCRQHSGQTNTLVSIKCNIKSVALLKWQSQRWIFYIITSQAFCLRVCDWEEVLLLFVTICYNLSALEDGKLGYQT